MQRGRVVGVTGFMGAGKDTLASYLVRAKGFSHISLSDLLREEVRRRHQTPSVELLRKVGNELREAEGFGVLGRLACSKIAKEDDGKGQHQHVITSIRHPAEVDELRRGFGSAFCLVFVDAPSPVRFGRVKSRARVGDMTSLEEFITAENAQLASTNPAGQQLLQCKEAADVVLSNDTRSEAAFEQCIDTWLQQYYQ